MLQTLKYVYIIKYIFTTVLSIAHFLKMFKI